MPIRDRAFTIYELFILLYFKSLNINISKNLTFRGVQKFKNRKN